MKVIGKSKNIEPILHWASIYLKSQRKEWPRDKLAVVFDIDETVVYRVAHSATDERYAHPAMLDIYKLALELGYHIFFITARIDVPSSRKETVKELRSLGFKKYDGLFMMPEMFLETQEFSLYKWRARQRILEGKFHIVLNSGDQWHDLLLIDPHAFVQNESVKFAQKMPTNEYIIFQPDPTNASWYAVKFPNRR